MSNWARIAYMDRCLNDKFKKCFTVNEIAEKFEVSTRQVKKDIEYMRYQLQVQFLLELVVKATYL
jgi:predicted DNA-binding transcriptional regulator YafY